MQYDMCFSLLPDGNKLDTYIGRVMVVTRDQGNQNKEKETMGSGQAHHEPSTHNWCPGRAREQNQAEASM